MKTAVFIWISCFILSQQALADDVQQLQGRWLQDCRNQVVRTEEFAGDQVTLSETFFNDSQCQQPQLVFISAGSYMLPQANQLDFRFSAVRLRLQTQDLVQKFNQVQMCGASDWELGTEKDISGQICALFSTGRKVPAAGDMRYGLYRVEGNQLWFGKLSKDQDASSPEKRPNEWDPNPYTRAP